MVDRYVNTSEMTTIVAKGLLLYARRQNMATVVYIGSEAEKEWESWCRTYPQWKDFVMQEQYSLFNRVQLYRDTGDNYSHKERLQRS